MSISIGKAIQKVQSMYSHGVESKDTLFVDRHIYASLLTGRSTVIIQKSNKNQYLNNWVYQVLYRIDLEIVDSNKSGIGTQQILKSVNKIPRIISDMDGDMTRVVTSLDGTTRYKVSNYDDVKYANGAKYTSTLPKAYIEDGYLFMTNTLSLKAVSMRAAFEDPIEVYLFNLNVYEDCIDCNCKSAYDIEFAIDEDMLGTAIKIVESDLELLLQIKPDSEDNAREDSGVAGAMVHQNQGQ